MLYGGELTTPAFFAWAVSVSFVINCDKSAWRVNIRHRTFSSPLFLETDFEIYHCVSSRVRDLVISAVSRFRGFVVSWFRSQTNAKQFGGQEKGYYSYFIVL